jgi:hypothetical protein
VQGFLSSHDGGQVNSEAGGFTGSGVVVFESVPEGVLSFDGEGFVMQTPQSASHVVQFSSEPHILSPQNDFNFTLSLFSEATVSGWKKLAVFKPGCALLSS